jgi:hypothetical protein
MALKAAMARSLGGLIRIFEYVFYGVAALVSFAVAHDADAAKSQAPQWIKESISFLHNFGGSWLWAIAALGAFTTFSRKFIGPKEVWSAVHTLLNDFRDRAFESQEDPHANRVTLFRHQKWCLKSTAWFKMLTQGKWIWGGWLIPVERSGDMAQNPTVAFYAPMDYPNQAEGFAGIVFRRRVTLDLQELPALNSQMLKSNAGENTLKSYCESTNVSIKEIKKRLKRNEMCGRCFWGLHLEKEDASIWGVLVIDSHQPNIRPKDEIYDEYKSLAKILDAMLREI